MYLIGYDIGSSSVKACVVDAQTGKTLSTAFYPCLLYTSDAADE